MLGTYVTVLALLVTLGALAIQEWRARKSDSEAARLISILELRASRIRAELKDHYHHVPVDKFMQRFEFLHKKHIEALRRGDLTLAHEILLEIHALSAELERQELDVRMAAYDPDPYAGLFVDGPMICLYVTGAARANRCPTAPNVYAEVRRSATLLGRLKAWFTDLWRGLACQDSKWC
jgi:hypothetical protein